MTLFLELPGPVAPSSKQPFVFFSTGEMQENS
jgi:hypothetical protein